MSWRLRGAEETQTAGAILASQLRAGDVVGLIGDLGAGKTTLVRGLMGGVYQRSGRAASEGEALVSSPTYTLMQSYKCPTRSGLERVLHVDLYRLEDGDDLESTGYWDEVEEASVVVVEWVENIPGAWPGEGFRVELFHDEEGRRLEVSWEGGDASRVSRLKSALDKALCQ